MFRRLKQDIQVVFERDPAATGVWEVLLCYPGLHAIWMYRVAHGLWVRKWRFLARYISYWARFLTGIDIHPGATIRDGLFIDHGMGVVIGETAEIGENVTIYQGVTLGGTGKEKGKRHPTLGNNVVVGNGARILGSFRVGDNCRIGAGAVVLREVPDNCTVVGNPGRVVRTHGERPTLDHVNLPDPLANALQALQNQLESLEQRLDSVERERDTLRHQLDVTLTAKEAAK